MNQILAGKKGLILGIVNQHSIAYSIAKFAKEQGADLAITYQSQNLEKRTIPIAEELNCNTFIPLDVTKENEVVEAAKIIENKFGKLDFIVHSLAYSDKEELRGRFVDSTLNNFLNSMHISCYSLVSIMKNMEHLMKDGGSILTLTYNGANRVTPNYNVMGVAKAALEASVKYLAYDLGTQNIRVNAISAGAIKTLASSAIGGIKSMIDIQKNTSPLRRSVSQEEVASSAIYLLSDLSKGVTGEIHYVDCGYNVMSGISESM